MKNNTKTIMTLTLAAAISSCAGPDSYQSKSYKETPRTFGVNQVPNIETSGFEFTKKSTRTPASVMPLDMPSAVEDNLGSDAAISNKKLYFLTLFGQYENMKKYSAQFAAPTVNVCPHFHNSLLEHNGKKTPSFAGHVGAKSLKKFSYDLAKLSDPKYIATHPELSLPLAKDEVTPKVIDIFRSQASTINDSKMDELVHTAIDIHLSKTYAEIRELCEFGVSDNYYIYENMITHIKNSNFSPAEKNMNTLLKTTVFSNIALVTALDKIQVTPMRSIASVENKSAIPYTSELMTRFNVEWAQEYYNYLKNSK